MVDFDSVGKQHVEIAMEECDELGSDTFRRRYGFGQPREFMVWHNGVGYDSKAILGVALKHGSGTAAKSREFSGGMNGSAGFLEQLGYEVAPEKVEEDTTPAPGVEAWSEASELGPEASRSTWAVAARDILVATAGRYNALVTYKELAALVQMRTGIRTKQQIHHWVGDVLGRVSRECASRGEPLLASLCVNAQGSVGTSYTTVLHELRGDTDVDGDEQAAEERLACYSHFGATLPEGGGSATLTPALAAQRSKVRRIVRAEIPANVCPTCNMAIPPTGICDNCG